MKSETSTPGSLNTFFLVLVAGVTGAELMPLVGDLNANSLISNAYLCSADLSKGSDTLISRAEIQDSVCEG